MPCAIRSNTLAFSKRKRAVFTAISFPIVENSDGKKAFRACSLLSDYEQSKPLMKLKKV